MHARPERRDASSGSERSRRSTTSRPEVHCTSACCTDCSDGRDAQVGGMQCDAHGRFASLQPPPPFVRPAPTGGHGKACARSSARPARGCDGHSARRIAPSSSVNATPACVRSRARIGSHEPRRRHEPERRKSQGREPAQPAPPASSSSGASRVSGTHLPARSVPAARSSSPRRRGRPASSCRSPCRMTSAPSRTAPCSQARKSARARSAPLRASRARRAAPASTPGHDRAARADAPPGGWVGPHHGWRRAASPGEQPLVDGEDAVEHAVPAVLPLRVLAGASREQPSLGAIMCSTPRSSAPGSSERYRKPAPERVHLLGDAAVVGGEHRRAAGQRLERRQAEGLVADRATRRSRRPHAGPRSSRGSGYSRGPRGPGRERLDPRAQRSIAHHHERDTPVRRYTSRHIDGQAIRRASPARTGRRTAPPDRPARPSRVRAPTSSAWPRGMEEIEVDAQRHVRDVGHADALEVASREVRRHDGTVHRSRDAPRVPATTPVRGSAAAAVRDPGAAPPGAAGLRDRTRRPVRDTAGARGRSARGRSRRCPPR